MVRLRPFFAFFVLKTFQVRHASANNIYWPYYRSNDVWKARKLTRFLYTPNCHVWAARKDSDSLDKEGRRKCDNSYFFWSVALRHGNYPRNWNVWLRRDASGRVGDPESLHRSAQILNNWRQLIRGWLKGNVLTVESQRISSWTGKCRWRAYFLF